MDYVFLLSKNIVSLPKSVICPRFPVLPKSVICPRFPVPDFRNSASNIVRGRGPIVVPNPTLPLFQVSQARMACQARRYPPSTLIYTVEPSIGSLLARPQAPVDILAKTLPSEDSLHHLRVSRVVHNSWRCLPAYLPHLGDCAEHVPPDLGSRLLGRVPVPLHPKGSGS